MAEAKKKEKSANSFFQRVTGSGSAVNDEARELYIQAGNAAKAEGNYPMSIEAYEKALNLSSEDYEKTAMYEAIGSSYKMFDLPKAIPALTRAAELQMSQGKWTMASQILEKIAEFYEELNDQENMLKTLKEACRFLKQEGQKASVNRVQKKIAESYILQGKFIDAQQEYEEMANKSKDDSMLKYNAKELWFRASLCALCIDVENLNTALNRYLNDNPLFEERSIEVKLLRQLISSVEEQDKDSFLKQIEEMPSAALRTDRTIRFMIEHITKKLNGDLDLK